MGKLRSPPVRIEEAPKVGAFRQERTRNVLYGRTDENPEKVRKGGDGCIGHNLQEKSE